MRYMIRGTAGLGATPSQMPVLQVGSNGPLVEAVQQQLNVVAQGSGGFSGAECRQRGTGSEWPCTLGADGDFGSRTKSAVLGFQRRAGVPATGSVDAATWPKLFPGSRLDEVAGLATSGGSSGSSRTAAVPPAPRSSSSGGAMMPAGPVSMGPPAEEPGFWSQYGWWVGGGTVALISIGLIFWAVSGKKAD